MLSHVGPYRGRVALFLLCTVTVSFAELWLYRTFQSVLDKVVPDKDVGTLLMLIGWLTGVILLRYVAELGRNLLERIVREYAMKDVQAAVFRQLRRLGFAYSERHPVGETLSLLNTDVAAMQEVYRWYLPTLVYQFLMFFVALGFILTTNIWLALCTVPSYFLYYLVSPQLDRRISYWGRQRADRISEWNKQIYDNVSGIREIRAYGREDWDVGRLEARFHPLIHSTRKTVLFSDTRGFVRRFTSIIGMAIAYVLAAGMYREGEITIGEFVAFSFYYLFLMTAMAVIVSNIAQIMVIAYQGERVKKFLELEPEVREADEPVQLRELRGSIQFCGVRFGYEADRLILSNFSLSIEPGKRVALVGHSGSGKSTVLKLVSRFYDPLEGDILLDGVPLRDLSLEQLRESTGLVMQEMYLFSATVRDNIRFGRPDATDQEIEDAAKAAYAHDFIQQLEHGYDTLIGERGVGLSGGQRQRICIARMMIKDPAILLLDEATSALDNESEVEVQSALDRLLKGRTTLTIAHRLSTIRHYDQIVVVEDGTIAEIGTYDELMLRRGALHRLVHEKGLSEPERQGD